MSEAEFVPVPDRGLRAACQHSKAGSIHYICMDWRHMVEMMAAGNAVYTELKNLCVWTKTNGGMGTFYRSQHELVFVWKRPRPHINNIELGQYGRNRTNVWNYAGVNTFRQGRLEELAMHPTVKPVAWWLTPSRIAPPGGLVLDRFAAAARYCRSRATGRKARALEIDPRYVDVAVRRWQTYTGKSAVLAATGEILRAD